MKLLKVLYEVPSDPHNQPTIIVKSLNDTIPTFDKFERLIHLVWHTGGAVDINGYVEVFEKDMRHIDHKIFVEYRG